MPVMFSVRLQRWTLTLGTYNDTIKYKSGKQQGNTDAVCWFSLPDSPASVHILAEIVAVMEHLSYSFNC